MNETPALHTFEQFRALEYRAPGHRKDTLFELKDAVLTGET